MWMTPLKIDSGRRHSGLRKPVKADVGEQLVLREYVFRMTSAVAPGLKLLDDPSR
jgi:hypothetical protein